MATGTTGRGTQKTECVRTLLNQNQPGAHGGFAADFATADGQRVLVTASTWQQVADLGHATRPAPSPSWNASRAGRIAIIRAISSRAGSTGLPERAGDIIDRSEKYLNNSERTVVLRSACGGSRVRAGLGARRAWSRRRTTHQGPPDREGLQADGDRTGWTASWTETAMTGPIIRTA